MANIKFSKSVEVALAFICLILSMSVSIRAQTECKSSSGATYILENDKKMIYNRDNSISVNDKFTTQDFYVKNHYIVTSAVSKCLSEERLKQLKGQKMVMLFNCDRDGSIKSIKFLFRDTCPLTVDEIENIETTMMKQKFTIDSNIEENTCVQFAVPCFFSKLL